MAKRSKKIRKRRVAFDGAVKVVPKKGGQPAVYKHVDLSIGGVFVETVEPLPVGTPVEVELRLVRLPFKAAATVAWIRSIGIESGKPAGMGLEFEGLNPVQRRGLSLQIEEALAHGGEARPGTPPDAAELAAQREGSKQARSPSSESFLSRLIRPLKAGIRSD